MLACARTRLSRIHVWEKVSGSIRGQVRLRLREDAGSKGDAAEIKALGEAEERQAEDAESLKAGRVGGQGGVRGRVRAPGRRRSRRKRGGGGAGVGRERRAK